MQPRSRSQYPVSIMKFNSAANALPQSARPVVTQGRDLSDHSGQGSQPILRDGRHPCYSWGVVAGRGRSGSTGEPSDGPGRDPGEPPPVCSPRHQNRVAVVH